jgi:hypothetical protein
MAQWIPMGLEESMMVWFGSVDICSAVIDADRLSQDFGNPGGYTFARMVISTPDHVAVATYIITQLISVPAWWHCRWQLYLACIAWYLLHERAWVE